MFFHSTLYCIDIFLRNLTLPSSYLFVPHDQSQPLPVYIPPTSILTLCLTPPLSLLSYLSLLFLPTPSPLISPSLFCTDATNVYWPYLSFNITFCVKNLHNCSFFFPFFLIVSFLGECYVPVLPGWKGDLQVNYVIDTFLVVIIVFHPKYRSLGDLPKYGILHQKWPHVLPPTSDGGARCERQWFWSRWDNC